MLGPDSDPGSQHDTRLCSPPVFTVSSSSVPCCGGDYLAFKLEMVKSRKVCHNFFSSFKKVIILLFIYMCAFMHKSVSTEARTGCRTPGAVSCPSWLLGTKFLNHSAPAHNSSYCSTFTVSVKCLGKLDTKCCKCERPVWYAHKLSLYATLITLYDTQMCCVSFTYLTSSALNLQSLNHVKYFLSPWAI